MAEIHLDDLLKRRAEEGTSSALAETREDVAEEIARKVETITPEERAKIDKLKESIDLMDSGAAVQYGDSAQKNIAEFSDQILQTIRGKDSGYVGDLLSQLVGNVKASGGKDKSGFLKDLPVVGSLFSKAENAITSYQTLSTQVDRIKADLEKSKMTMMKDIVMFDGLYEKNLEYFKALELYIRAGEEKVEELKKTTLPRLREEAAASGNPMAAQVVSDFENAADRFEKKVHDLKLSKTIAIQTAPQIRLIQNSDKALVERIQSAIYNTIPLWKNQMVIALGLTHQDKILKTQAAISSVTNELLRKNAEMLKSTTIETAKENERSIVDIETVKKVNEDLVTTIEETLKIQREGRARRQAAERELAGIEERLKRTLLANSSVKRPA